MCMFCVIQKWSRRVATMLPWLVIPLIGLWALSQLLPPAFRFEITSPRLACVFVLLVTLFWYEVLMPQLSSWRVRRNALLRERKRSEALELQKLKKTATRKCRNCLTPYKDQNPGGGKFMCSYCGHISKRPVLDLPIPPGMSNSGLIKELFGKGGKILNGGNWSDSVSLCNQEWLENGNWVVNGSFPVSSCYPLRKDGVGLFGRSEPCLAEKSYSGACFFICKLLMSFLLSIRWLWRKLFRIGSSEDASANANHRTLMKKGENGVGGESKGEKARRKAEEKKLARLEKEILEEEERKQREEVAKLVEERRRLRDEMLEAENRAKGASSLKEKDSKKEAERRRQERRKEKDKGSSKSNSDVDELDRKTAKDNERKRDTEKKIENDRRESPKTGVHTTDSRHEAKGNTSNNSSKGNVGSRYFDRMKGTLLSSSKAFTGSGFFGKAAPVSTSVSKEMKPDSAVDHSLFSNNRGDFHPVERLPGKAGMNADDKVNIRPVTADSHRKTTQMSWHQLFVRSSPASNSNVISRPTAKAKAEGQSTHLPCAVPSATLYDNPIDLPSPFTLPPFSSGPLASSASLSAVKDPLFPSALDRPRGPLAEEPELFEDPCYVPDPVSLLGPVSESLDNFQLDRGASYLDEEFRKSCSVIRTSSPPEVARPSPIESPLSRMRVADEKQNNSSNFFGNLKSLDMHSFPASDMNNHNDTGTWHMWNSSPLGPDGLNLVGNTTDWIGPLDRSRLNSEEMRHYSPKNTMASLFSKDGQIVFGTHSSQKVLMENAPNSNGHHHPISSLNDQDPWLQSAFFPPLSACENQASIVSSEGGSQKKIVFGSPVMAAANTGFDPPTANCLSKNEWSIEGSGEGVRNFSTSRSHVGGLYSVPDVQSLWSFE